MRLTAAGLRRGRHILSARSYNGIKLRGSLSRSLPGVFWRWFLPGDELNDSDWKSLREDHKGTDSPYGNRR